MTKEKSTVPRLRFPGFTDAWKQRKLGEVLKERNESRSPSADVPLVSFTVENGVTPKTERYNREFLVRDEDKKYKFTQLDDIVYNPANLKFGAIARNKYGAAVFSPIYVTYGVLSEAHPLFVELIVTSTNFIQRALRYQEGTVYERMAVKSFDLLRSEIPLPTLPEQEAIGSFFSDLDQLITLHQRKLDDVKELKKALLQKMFPKGNGNDFPELRFPEFTDAWKQRKLGEVATFAKGNGYSKKDLVIEGSPIILYGRLYTKYETVISEVDTFVSVEDNNNSVVYSEGGEVLVPASGESSLDIARASVVAKKGIILGGDINIIRLHSEIFPVFLALTISNGKQQKGLSKRAQGKSVVHLHNSDLKKVDLDFPTLPEQEVIGSFFSDLDQLITLHQRQLDHLKLLKKALLQQMFI
ncbi:TPA: restriction endonuclease subunit S [Streptococcus suis]|nr:restriction endonuclease subunit S [Streptococcus suis]HEM6357278.1 restriction endonuclease subunit S [Streptococcus suis]HEM6381444.1 restriction endonuclease subunit S [Streptococcus suis]